MDKWLEYCGHKIQDCSSIDSNPGMDKGILPKKKYFSQISQRQKREYGN